jgi:hypothetical protein
VGVGSTSSSTVDEETTADSVGTAVLTGVDGWHPNKMSMLKTSSKTTNIFSCFSSRIQLHTNLVANYTLIIT